MNRILCITVLAAAASGSPAGASFLFDNSFNLAIPLNFDGVFFNPESGMTCVNFPDDWDTAPWINLFFGGVTIGNSPRLMPVITGPAQIVNLAPGSVIDSGANFAPGESGSAGHFGPGAGRFTSGEPGFIGFRFLSNAGADYQYGWMKVILSNTGGAAILSYAINDAARTAIVAAEIPEPPTPLLDGLGKSSVLRSRKRAITF